jgi:hypothetical protein
VADGDPSIVLTNESLESTFGSGTNASAIGELF